MLDRGSLDSAFVNCLLGLDDDVIVSSGNNLDSGSKDAAAL